MIKSLRLFKVLVPGFFCSGLVLPAVGADVNPTLGEMHPPVVASVGPQKVTVFFLKNNLREKVKDVHLANAEIFYSPINFGRPELNYVWKVEGDQIESVFFYEWKSPGRLGKSMYVLTKSHLTNGGFEGFTYSVMELPIIKDGDNISVKFFPQEAGDPNLENCNEGKNLDTGSYVKCAYKDAGSVKKYLSSQDR